MIDLISLKKHSLYQLKEHFESFNFDDQTGDLVSIQFEIDDVDFITLAKYLNCKKITYFKDKNDNEILGIGTSFEQVDSLSKKKITQILETNEDIIAFDLNNFYNERLTSSEFKNLPSNLTIIPKICITKNKSGTQCRFYVPRDVFNSKVDQMSYLMEIDRIFSFKLNETKISKIQENIAIPNKDGWNKIINNAKELLKSQLKKIVISRKIINYHFEPINPLAFLEENTNFNNYTFFIKFNDYQGFVSHTPEKLFELTNKEIIIDSIAGTRPRGKSEKEDAELAKELSHDEKELHEHRLVTNDIVGKIESIGLKATVIKSETILKQKHVQHLHTLISAKAKELNIDELLDLLHPTPAIGGHPTKKSLDFLKKLEPYERGYYSAPIGILNKKRSLYLVGIRSALINNNEVHIYAGAGIVKQSVATNEWVETTNKMRNFSYE